MASSKEEVMLTLGGKVNLRRTQHKIVRHLYILMYPVMHFLCSFKKSYIKKRETTVQCDLFMAAVTLAFFKNQNSFLELIRLDIYFDPARHRQSNEADGKTGEVSKKKFEKKSYFIFLKIIQVHLIQQKV